MIAIFQFKSFDLAEENLSSVICKNFLVISLRFYLSMETNVARMAIASHLQNSFCLLDIGTGTESLTLNIINKL